jgi:hypothetical protein
MHILYSGTYLAKLTVLLGGLAGVKPSRSYGTNKVRLRDLLIHARKEK